MVKKMIKDSYLTALRILAKLELLKHKKATIIGITGSSGKTSCKEMVVAFLKPHFKNALKYTVKGNSETGIPYEILNIPVRHYKIWEYPFILIQGLLHLLFVYEKYSIFVIEYGIDGPEYPINMDYLLRIVKPHYALLLSVSEVHGEHFEQTVDKNLSGKAKAESIRRAIAREKFKLLQAVKNSKNAYITKQAATYIDSDLLTQATILDNVVTTKITSWENTTDGITFTVSTPRGDITTTLPELTLPESAKQNIHFSCLMTAVSKKDIRVSLTKLPDNYHVEPGRSSLLLGLNESIILDSSYNANPYAAKELFGIMKNMTKRTRRKKIIVLGDFRELGTQTQEIYREVIKEAVKIADILVLTNSLMKKYGIEAAEDAGMVLNENLYWFENGKQLSFHINEIVEKNAVVLFEGSQNKVFLEYAVYELCAKKDPEYVRSHIPRMSRDWLEIK